MFRYFAIDNFHQDIMFCHCSCHFCATRKRICNLDPFEGSLGVTRCAIVWSEISDLIIMLISEDVRRTMWLCKGARGEFGSRGEITRAAIAEVRCGGGMLHYTYS